MRAYELLEDMKVNEKLPPEVAKAFTAVADQQRGAPEMAMLRVQKVMGGGVLSPVVEHVGDILHRMTEHADVPYWLEDIVEEKVKRGLRYLTHPYGFEREMQENIRANDTDAAKLDQMLAQYAKEHEKLPVYNVAHYHARESAVALGHKDWKKAIEHLTALKGMLDSGNYKKAVSSYITDSKGHLDQYAP